MTTEPVIHTSYMQFREASAKMLLLNKTGRRWEPVQSGLMSGARGGGATQSGPMWSTRSRGGEALYGQVNAPVL